MENIQYACRTRDGEIHELNIRGAANITEAIFEFATSLMHGEIELDGKHYTVDDIAGYLDIPG